MARVDIPVTSISRTGVAPPAQVSSDATNDHVIDGNDGRVFLEAQNVDGSSAHTVTVVTPGSVAGLAVADLDVSVPASSTRLIGPLPTTVFNQTGTDNVHVDVATANLRFRAYKL